MVARRLVTSPGIRYLIEAVPSGSLDVVLEVGRSRAGWQDPAIQGLIRRQDANGPGVSEFTYCRPDHDSWLVAGRQAEVRAGNRGSAGSGKPTPSTPRARPPSLPGLITGAPNAGQVAGFHRPVPGDPLAGDRGSGAPGP